jgi:phage shock protein C
MEKKLTRSKTDRMISGICGGLAKFTGMDSSLVRVAAVVICFVTALIPVLVIYAVMWIIVPEEIL